MLNTTADAPGANDDGSGVAAMMELAKSWEQTIGHLGCFVWEEQGLYRQDIWRNGQAEKWNIVAMLNNDMIGNSLSSGTRLSNNTKVRVFNWQFLILETEEEARCEKPLTSDNDQSVEVS
jgi:Zn-dependent M28 family amino/carboxypeptidase